LQLAGLAVPVCERLQSRAIQWQRWSVFVWGSLSGFLSFCMVTMLMPGLGNSLGWGPGGNSDAISLLAA